MEILFGGLEAGQLEQVLKFYKEDFDIHNYDMTMTIH